MSIYYKIKPGTTLKLLLLFITFSIIYACGSFKCYGSSSRLHYHNGFIDPDGRCNFTPVGNPRVTKLKVLPTHKTNSTQSTQSTMESPEFSLASLIETSDFRDLFCFRDQNIRLEQDPVRKQWYFWQPKDLSFTCDKNPYIEHNINELQIKVFNNKKNVFIFGNSDDLYNFKFRDNRVIELSGNRILLSGESTISERCSYSSMIQCLHIILFKRMSFKFIGEIFSNEQIEGLPADLKICPKALYERITSLWRPYILPELKEYGLKEYKEESLPYHTDIASEVFKQISCLLLMQKILQMNDVFIFGAAEFMKDVINKCEINLENNISLKNTYKRKSFSKRNFLCSKIDENIITLKKPFLVKAGAICLEFFGFDIKTKILEVHPPLVTRLIAQINYNDEDSEAQHQRGLINSWENANGVEDAREDSKHQSKICKKRNSPDDAKTMPLDELNSQEEKQMTQRLSSPSMRDEEKSWLRQKVISNYEKNIDLINSLQQIYGICQTHFVRRNSFSLAQDQRTTSDNATQNTYNPQQDSIMHLHKLSAKTEHLDMHSTNRAANNLYSTPNVPVESVLAEQFIYYRGNNTKERIEYSEAQEIMKTQSKLPQEKFRRLT